MKLSTLEKRANHIIKNCNGDIEFAKKITFNNAKIAIDEGDEEQLDNEATVFQHLKNKQKKIF